MFRWLTSKARKRRGEDRPTETAFGFRTLPSDDLTVPQRAKPGDYAGASVAARASFENTRKQALKAGCTYYLWRSCGDSDVCEHCRHQNGKRFRFSAPPAVTGHPGDGRCCPHGLCRCYAEPVLPAG